MCLNYFEPFSKKKNIEYFTGVHTSFSAHLINVFLLLKAHS